MPFYSCPACGWVLSRSTLIGADEVVRCPQIRQSFGKPPVACAGQILSGNTLGAAPSAAAAGSGGAATAAGSGGAATINTAQWSQKRSTLVDALNVVTTHNDPHSVWCIVHLSKEKSDAFYVFFSSNNVVQTIANVPYVRDDDVKTMWFNDQNNPRLSHATMQALAASGVDIKKNALISAAKRQIHSVLGGYVGSEGMEMVMGHAEERVVRSWGPMCADFTQKAGSAPGTATIYLSDSPCSPFDPEPSNNLVDQPKSCCDKLVRLRKENPSILFNVQFCRVYLQKRPQMDQKPEIRLKIIQYLESNGFKLVSEQIAGIMRGILGDKYPLDKLASKH